MFIVELHRMLYSVPRRWSSSPSSAPRLEASVGRGLLTAKVGGGWGAPGASVR